MFTARLRFHRFRSLSLLAVGWALLAFAVSGGAPASVVTATATNGADFASQELGNAWDMSGPEDIAFEYTRDHGNGDNGVPHPFTDLSFSNGILSATATGNDPRITLMIPSDPGVNPVPPEGGYRPIDASKYKYLTVRLNVPTTTYAQVFWQAGPGQAFGASGIKQVTAGWSTVTIDLTAGGQGSIGSWSGMIQGLYFDPMITSGAFQIDFVRLSTTVPVDPNNAPPQLDITAPSFISGPDYASNEVGNAWDMNDASDVTTHELTGVSFNGGILTATNVQGHSNCGGVVCGDPQLTLHTGAPLNTGKYKYFTYRMKLDGQIDTVNGSVGRVIWWTTIPQQSSTSLSWVIYEGYRTVSLDLSKIRLEPGAPLTWQQSNPIVFRFDPHEFAAPHTFHLDYVMLTGDDTANASYNIRYQASDPDGSEPTPQFFYDTDTNPDNGTGTAITCGTANAVAAANFQVYLPFVTRFGAPPPVEPAGSTCRWDTAGVPAGKYYIYGVVSDGADTTSTYSQTPVVISH